jgi:hypothetical protein
MEGFTIYDLRVVTTYLGCLGWPWTLRNLCSRPSGGVTAALESEKSHPDHGVHYRMEIATSILHLVNRKS